MDDNKRGRSRDKKMDREKETSKGKVQVGGGGWFITCLYIQFLLRFGDGWQYSNPNSTILTQRQKNEFCMGSNPASTAEVEEHQAR